MQFNLNSSNLPENTPGSIRVGQGLCILFGVFVIMLFAVSVIVQIAVPAGEQTTRTLRFATIIQDLFVFVLPAILAAYLSTRLPARLLSVDKLPKLSVLIMACVVLLTSMPAMDWIVSLNESLDLPEVFGNMEESATGSVNMLMGSGSVMDIVMSVLIIGILTGLAEELFFRGALQGILFGTRINRHAVIWIVAIVFSAMHFQFYGFIPRMLLGAYFGYLVWWSGSLWTSIAVHALNNSLVAVVQSLSESPATAQSDTVSIDSDALSIALSFAVTALGIIILYRKAHIPAKR